MMLIDVKIIHGTVNLIDRRRRHDFNDAVPLLEENCV